MITVASKPAGAATAASPGSAVASAVGVLAAVA
jgi:hypothetical protein